MPVDVQGHAIQCVERYCELAGKEIGKLRQYDTPCIDDHQLKPEDFETKGKVSETAANIVLKILYLARIGRPDLLWTVNILARAVTKWTQACDKRLERLIGYLYKTRAHRQFCFVDNTPDECSLGFFKTHLLLATSRTPSLLLVVCYAYFGSRTFVPITWMCKKQTAVSHSSAETEVISLDAGLRMEGLPALMFWDQVIEAFSDKPAKTSTEKPGAKKLDPVAKFIQKY